MTTATAETQTEREVVTFLAKSPNLIVTRIPEDIVTDARGRQIDKITRQREVRKLEEENKERLNHDLEPKPLDDVSAPWKIEFGKDDPSHHFKTDDPVLISFLRNHDLFNNPRGFWEIGAAPDEPKPTVAEQTQAIAIASVQANPEALEEILAIEKETHNRTDVVLAAEAGLATIAELEGQAAPAGDTDQTGDPPSTSAN